MAISCPPRHPLSDAISSELHARPSPPLKPLQAITRVSLLTAERSVDADRDFIHRLSARLGEADPMLEANWHMIKQGDSLLRWERHSEMSTFTFCWPLQDSETRLARLLPPDWPEDLLADAPGMLLSGVHVEIRAGAASEDPELARTFGAEAAIQSSADGRFIAVTDFQQRDDGFSRMIVFSDGVEPQALGRYVQKLLEIDTYRTAALLAFPLATDLRSKLASIELELAGVMFELVDGGQGTGDPQLLNQVAQLSARVEALVAQTSYRFAASRAYHRLVGERLKALRGGGAPLAAEAAAQDFESFLSRRLEPAMRTCDAVEARLQSLAERISRATRLLGTRVEVKLGEQNAELLASMNARTRLQLRLQQTVEGLSVFAISYYAVGLVSYAAKAVEEAGAPVNPYIVTGLAAPVIIAALWLGLRRFHKRLVHAYGAQQ